MDLLLTSKIQKTHGPLVRINCPACGATEVPAETLQQVDQFALFYYIPLFRLKNTFVICSSCRKETISAVTIDEIAHMSVGDLSSHLAVRESFVSKVVAILAILLFFVPFVGLGLGVLGVLLNLRTIGWPKTLSYVSAFLGAIITVGIIIAMNVVD